MTIDLDIDQRRVVEAPPRTRTVVTAGAGRGKTEVVAARVQFLRDVHDLYPPEEILVLSFSRAAVDTVRRRFEMAGNVGALVLTFDSFAARVLYDAGVDTSEVRGFDARVRRAAEILNERAPDEVSLLRHIVLDEVQDLVGDRALLALRLLNAADAECGFTALGDPLQAIYDWQLADAHSPMDPESFRHALVEELGASEQALTRDYRAADVDPRRVVVLGDVLREVETAHVARELLKDFRTTLPDIGTLSDSANLVHRTGLSTAVLCRTNGAALAVSRDLRSQGVSHVLRRPLEDVGIASWVASALRGARTRRVPRDAALDMLRAAGVEDPDDAWVELKTAEGDARTSDVLDLERLRRVLRSRSIPLSLAASGHADVVVSSVHRAKGLEFDRVIVIDRGWAPDDEDDWTESRIDYVALSRARSQVLVADASPRGRWIRRYPARHPQRFCAMTKRAKSYPWAVEVQSSDTSSTDPLAEAQDRLSRVATIGQEVEGRLIESSDVERPLYALVSEQDEVVGQTSITFGETLAHTFGRRRPGETWPYRLDGMFVTAVETVAGEADQTERAGMGMSGLWLVPRLGGMARPVWNEETDGTG